MLLLTLLFTKLLPPITESFPIDILCLIIAPIPKADLLPNLTFPPRMAPGATDEKSSKEHSWSTDDELLIITPLPTVDDGPK